MRLFLLTTAIVIALFAYWHWTEPPPTLFERLLETTPIPNHKLEDAVPSLLERGYSCDEILLTIAEVRAFIRRQVLKVSQDAVQSLVALRLAEERERRTLEARTHPHVYSGGLMWLRLKKAVLGGQNAPSQCP